MLKSSARTNWQLRMQRRLGAEYLRGQSSRRRKLAIVAAVATVHVGMVLGFLSLRADPAAQPILVKVRILPGFAARAGAHPG